MDTTWWSAIGDNMATLAGSLLAGFGLVLTGLGLFYSAGQLNQSKQVAKDSMRIARGEFLLHLEQLL